MGSSVPAFAFHPSVYISAAPSMAEAVSSRDCPKNVRGMGQVGGQATRFSDLMDPLQRSPHKPSRNSLF